MYVITVIFLDTDLEKGIWENNQKTAYGFTEHEKVCIML